MPTDVISLRPVPVPLLVPCPGGRPVLVPSPRPTRPLVPVPVPVRPVVEWDACRGVYVAVCDRCCESLDVFSLDQAHEWADTHRCDPELAALLAEVLTRRAA